MHHSLDLLNLSKIIPKSAQYLSSHLLSRSLTYQDIDPFLKMKKMQLYILPVNNRVVFPYQTINVRIPETYQYDGTQLVVYHLVWSQYFPFNKSKTFFCFFSEEIQFDDRCSSYLRLEPCKRIKYWHDRNVCSIWNYP